MFENKINVCVCVCVCVRVRERERENQEEGQQINEPEHIKHFTE